MGQAIKTLKVIVLLIAVVPGFVGAQGELVANPGARAHLKSIKRYSQVRYQELGGTEWRRQSFTYYDTNYSIQLPESTATISFEGNMSTRQTYFNDAGNPNMAIWATKFKSKYFYDKEGFLNVMVSPESALGCKQKTPDTMVCKYLESNRPLSAFQTYKRVQKPKGFGLGKLKQTVAPERQSTQVSGSGGARG